MSALLPCPFCGGRNPGLWHQDVGVKSFPRVNCGACGSGTGFSPKWSDDDAIAAWNQRATPAEVEKLRADVERLRGALSPLVAVIPDICNALDLDPDETSIRVRVDGGARDGEVLAERTLADMLTAASAALTHKEPSNEG